jgi:hypothetical protein
MSAIAIFQQQRCSSNLGLDPSLVLNYCGLMRAGLCFILIIILAMSFAALAQAPSQSQFLVRLKYVKSDLPLGVSTTCIAVFPDGRFHLEQRADWPESKPQIYEDSLPDNDLRSLRTIIDDPELRNLKGIDTGNMVFRQREHGEVVWALISRGEATQRLLFNSQTGTPERSSKALPKPLGALVGWSDATAKTLNSRKVRPLKNAKPVMCWLAN